MVGGTCRTSLGGSSDASNDSGWLDIESDEESEAVISFFGSESFSSLDGMLAHCTQHHGFDFLANTRRLQLDFLGAVKLVNFIRRCVQQGQPLPDVISQSDIDHDEYLKPVLSNDAVLFSLDDVLEATDEVADAADEQTMALLARNRQLEAELEAVHSSFANYRLTVQQMLDQRWGNDDDLESTPSASSHAAVAQDSSDFYFESYATHDIHETMLKDKVRTDAYRDFIYENKHLFKDKVVLDIGCGTGILSMFCSKAGAAHVLAVDKSDIIDKARENVFNNGLSGVVTCLRGAIEDVTLPVDKVDIIVSEWMGYCLLSATLWIAPVEDQHYISDYVSYWGDVYGFDMKAMQEGVYDEVCIQTMPSTSVCGDAFPFKILDLRFTRTEDLVFTAGWGSKLNRRVDNIDGFLVWFDIFFATSWNEQPPGPETTSQVWKSNKRGNVAFTTGPYGTETHWRHGLLLAAPQPSPPELPHSCPMSGSITFSLLEQNSRALMIDASWSVVGQQRSQSWELK
ncbi:hypothetical protein G6O67_005707 [Ophiocordyceps sinensis]|uniref:type I protein arginine methyltransferase n=1 Tax=Ophiocordyceps sinensis TaxID=72228 RepID=A0A8H4LWT7_9HYPO|nr:hypothetical protein G6O67_005707 [Ophiocordyceps sinensis]